MQPAPRLAASRGRLLYALVLAAVATLLIAYTVVIATNPANAAVTLLSQGQPATASSTENAGTPASAGVDGNTGTRWSSAAADPQWLQVDLGATANISQVVLRWEAAYATAFQVQTSANGSTWTSIYSTTTGTGGVQTLNITGTGRYVRVYGTARATQYGYSLWEFQVYGELAGGGGCGTANAAQGKPATASSVENAGTPATAAVDGSGTTRWSSAAADPQWLQIDLGSTQSICQIILTWEAAYATAYQIQLSDNASAWTTVYSTTTSTGGTQTLNVAGSGRYVRIYGTARATGYGYSLWEVAVRTGTPTSPSPSPSPTPSPSGGTIPGGGSLGSNVKVFDPSMSGATIQAQVDAIFNEMESNQFGTQRYVLAFKPGTYSGFNAQIGFYTSIIGLGQNPGDVRINGDVTVDAGWFQGNATQNFWRSAENLSVYPSAGFTRWAVSQAAPFRRMDIHGDLNLAPNGYGWASGGYIADSRVSGSVGPYSQQQWYTRDSQIGGWVNGVWNMVFSGVQGAPATGFPNPVYTTLATTPLSREKPYLYLDSGGNYRVFVPSLRTNASGTSWAAGSTPGSSLPLSSFYVAKPGDSAARINQALAQGLHLLFTPGIYHVNQTINVNRADTVVLGLGYATIIPDNGVTAMQVADVDGVKVAGILFDAGATNSPNLLVMGASTSGVSHAANPSSISDVFFRIGGAGPGKATNSLLVNSNNVIIDHIWAWRGDHGAGIGWTVNTADTGLIVNGNNVLATGLFVEHYQKYNVIWNGQGGRTIFFQNELPYDPPNQAAYMNGTTKGYAAYKVANSVTTHEAWGMGSYCYFNVDPTIHAARGFEAPNSAGVKFHSLLTVSLGGNGVIDNVINTTGGPAQGTATVPSNVVSYP
ncbi:discoidin domain-containing protein [Catellatospora sp. KI3]|uniref:discoidin domain-containing protein n=1 Tax=Catellatospora sp. KI3 TaxID=3041620 RepID=UPI0024822C55|nr:discoidin domain-containing protein [Catellatospora sp. KI3]MDI1461568.1 discoidin domain-containing protein [Catellatospora sp. KI3]